MKKAILFLLTLPFLAIGQKSEKAVLRFDTASKVLTRVRFVEVVEIIDTARLYAEKARLVSELDRTNLAIDSVNAQIKAARKLMTKKKGGGNGNNNTPKAAETPPAIIPVTPTKPTTKPKKN